MSISRSESQVPPYARKRSNTVTSMVKNAILVQAAPLKYGDSKALTTWVHDAKELPPVLLNQSWWPGVAEGDLLQLTSPSFTSENSSGLIFIVPKDEAVKHQLQISVARPIAEKLDLRNNSEVLLTKVDKEKWCADYIEFTFQDQYLGRNEMWRLDQHLVGQCVYLDQEISFIGIVAARVHAIYINGQKVSTAYVTSCTKLVYRSLSARATIFIQVCQELWEFAGDGERYNEKIVHSFLPALFSKWKESNTTHIVTIVLISRVYYDESEIDYARGPLRQDEDGKWYKDFFKVITDLEVIYEWKPTLVSLKDSFWDFQRDILIAHHHHSAALVSPRDLPDNVRLVGRISYAHDGPILEALNLSFNPTETHYIDRSLSLTGSSTIIVTPGTGYFRAFKQLLRLTTTRILDQGFAIDLVSLAKPPLHQSPIFSFQGVEPETRPGMSGKAGWRAQDPLWGGDDDVNDYPSRPRTTFWWEPFWMSVSFWDKQMDLPFREDRFIARAKMHEIEMLGLLDHDVLSSIELPFLPELADGFTTPNPNSFNSSGVRKEAADSFDTDIFTPKPEWQKPAPASRNSVLPPTSSLRPTEGTKRNSSGRTTESSKISTIDESPRHATLELPTDTTAFDSDKRLSATGFSSLSTSPSQSSIRSIRSNRSRRSLLNPSRTAGGDDGGQRTGTTRPSASSRFTPSWLFSSFTRSRPSQPETTPISAAGVTSPLVTSPLTAGPSRPPTPVRTGGLPRVLPKQIPASGTPLPMPIKSPAGGGSGFNRSGDNDLNPHRASFPRNSPLGTPPLEGTLGRRRTLSSAVAPLSSSLPLVRTNPSRPRASVPFSQSSLASRWQHIFPQPLSKHDIKWKAMITPACLPLSTEYFPIASELETSYDLSPYDFVIDPPEMRSFLVKPPPVANNNTEVSRRAWALVVMRGMVALRLAQGFQFVLRPSRNATFEIEGSGILRRSTSYVGDEDMTPKINGAAEAVKNPHEPVYLSMSNEIHGITYSGDSIQVRRYVRRMPRAVPYDYQCLIWPKLGVGYTALETSFVSHGLENYGWNRLDMLVAGYENQFNESLRYWRTRFVVIPTDEPPLTSVGPLGEKLNDEEIRLLGMDKLAEMFSKVRWVPPEDKGKPTPAVRFLPTDLGPTHCVLDDTIMSQLDDIHAAGPLRKKAKSEREISEMSLPAIAKAMREEDGVPMKDHKWHGRVYAHSFTGAELVSWLVREFRDVPTREQATEWGAKLQDRGLFDHCRGAHGFLDGHYFYALRGEYIVPMTPRTGWFGRAARYEDNSALRIGNRNTSGRKLRKKLILSQSMVIDVDPNKKSDQAESIILHHDIIHNPATCFHFELHWIGTTARCIDDVLRQWGRTIERYGLKLVEAYVTQISDIRDRNPFQSCFPIPLALAPPKVPDLEGRIPEGAQTTNYFEAAILRRMGFVLDIEASHLYPEQVDVVYSYRRLPFRYSQWVHRSGVAFVQVVGGSEGFLFLTNRLMAPGRIGTIMKSQRPGVAADQIRMRLHQLCSDVKALEKIYEEEIDLLEPIMEEPTPLKL